MKILFIEICNYVDYPLGGQLSFAKHLTRAMGGEIDLVGCTTDMNEPLRKWTTKVIEGYKYNIFNICYEKNTTEKPFVPRRITIYNYIRKYHHLIDFSKYDCVMYQAPEVMLALPKDVLRKSCLVMPGVGNALQISRYKWARPFASLYDKVFFSRAQYCKCILAAADSEAIKCFANRSKGKVQAKNVIQFPTRYDAAIFNKKDKVALRAKYGISEGTTVFVTTGRLNWFKGWKLMIDAFKLYISSTNNHNTQLFFIGDGEEHERITTYINDNSLQDKVILLGRKSLDVVSEYLSLSDEFIMGSFAEGWSTSLVEAIASGIPCVVTDFSSSKEMIKDGYNGYVIENRDVSQFAKRMADALKLNNQNIDEACIKSQRLSVQRMKEVLFSLILPYYPRLITKS